MNLPFQLHVESLALGITVGLVFGMVLAEAKLRTFKRVIQMIGKESGYEKINGKWYRITLCSDTVVNLIEDMGMPTRIDHHK